MRNQIHFGDNLPFLKRLPGNLVDLIYIDPPFNTGKMQSRRQIKTTRSDSGDRIGFGDQSYTTEVIATRDYRDSFKDYRAFLEPRLLEAYRVLRLSGSLYFHIDFREALARDARPAGEFVLTQAGFTAGTLEHLGNIGKRRQSSLRASKQASSHKYCSPSDAHRQSIHLQKLRRRSRLASVCRNPKAQSRLLRFTLWRKRSSGVMPASFQAVTPVLKI